MPFGPGDHVSLSGANDANYTTKINNVSVLSVDTRSLSHIDGGLFQNSFKLIFEKLNIKFLWLMSDDNRNGFG